MKICDFVKNNNIWYVFFDLWNVVFEFSSWFEELAKITWLDYEYILNFWRKHDDSICRWKLKPNDFFKLLTNNKNSEFDFLNFWISCFSINNDIHNEIIKIQKLWLPIGIISNIYPGVFDIILNNWIIPNINYDKVFLSCDYWLVKPENEIFDIAFNSININKNKILFIDDSIINTTKAEEFWVKTITYKKP